MMDFCDKVINERFYWAKVYHQQLFTAGVNCMDRNEVIKRSLKKYYRDKNYSVADAFNEMIKPYPFQREKEDTFREYLKVKSQ